MNTVTVTNAGSTTEISGFTMGAGCTEFTASATFNAMPVSGSNPAVLANTETLVINVTYDSSDRVADTCTVTVLDNEPGPDETFDLTGDGIAPELTFSPTSLSFANQNWFSGAGETLMVQVNNIGEEDVAAGDYTVYTINQTGTHFGGLSPASGPAISAGGSTNISVTFNPTSIGAKSGNLRLQLSNDVPTLANSNPYQVGLSGTATEAVLTFAPATFNAGSAVPGNTTMATLTLGNTGADTANITAMSITGANASDFAFTDHSCTGQTCNTANNINMGNTDGYVISCTPSAGGARTATLNVTVGNDPLTPRTKALNCTGLTPTQTFSANPLNVGSAVIGNPVTNTMNIGNSGQAPLGITSMTITGGNFADFAFTDHMCTGQSCVPNPSSVAVGGSEAFIIRCTPSMAGSRTATLTVFSNDLSSPRTATLNCTGLAPEITVTPTSINFGTVRVSQTAMSSFLITNAASAGATGPLTYDVTEALADVSIVCTGGCSGTLAVDGMVTVTVTYAPSAISTLSGNVVVMANDPNEATTNVALQGNGAQSDLSVASPYNFGNVPVSQAGGSVQPIVITNNGGISLNTTTMTISGDAAFSFAFASNPCTSGTSCSRTVTAAANMGTASIPVRCDPTTSGLKTATLNIQSDDPSPVGGTTLTLNCTGTVPTMATSPASLSFGNQRINQSSGGMTFNISNAAGATVAPLNYTVTRPAAHFLVSVGATPCTPTCTGTLNAGVSQPVTVVFRPTSTGLKTDMVTVTGDDPNNPSDDIAVSGTGVEPLIVLDAPTPATPPTTGGSIAFGNVPNGTTSNPPQPITVRNNGTMDLMITGVTNTNPGDFDITGPASITLTMGMSQTWFVTCDPETRGAKAGTIQIVNDSNNDTSVDVALTCTSIEGLIVVTASTIPVVASTINFGPTRLGQMRSTTVTLTNQGNVAVNVSSVALASMTEGFSTGALSSTMVAPNNGTATFTVVFAPTLETQGMTTMAITTDWNDPNINLTGDGQLADMVMNPNPASIGNVNWDATATQVMTIQNLGSATINVMSVSFVTPTTEFTITGFTAGNLPGGMNRPFNLNATPSDTMLGLRTATVRLTTDLPPGMGQTIDVPVSYTSVGPAVTLNPGMVVDFGGVDVDGGPVTTQLMVTNSGTGVMDITSVSALTGVFGRTNFTDLSLDPSQVGAITISYDPTTERDPSSPETQTFTIVTDGLYAGGTQQPANIQVTVRGYGTDRHLLAPNVMFPPTYRNPTDAQVPTNTCGAAMNETCAIRICNTGGARLDVSMIDDPTDEFDLLSTAALQVPGGSAASPSCMEVPVEFRPTAYGQFTGTVTIMNNDNGNAMAVVTMQGAGIERPVGVTPNTVPATVIAQGAPVRLTDLMPEGLVIVNMSSTESFDAEVSATPNAANVTATLVGDDGTLTASQTRSLDIELIGTSPTTAPVNVVVEVHLDGDPLYHTQITIPIEVVRVDVEGGGCDSSGGGAAGGAALALLLLLLVRPSTRPRWRSVLLRTNGMLLLVVVVTAHADVSRNIDVGSAPTTTATEPGLFDVDTPDIAAKGSWALSFTGQYESNPMVARWTDTAMVEHELALIEQRNAFVVGFGYAVTDKLELSVRLPMFQQTGEEPMEGDPRGIDGAEGFSLGDVAVRAKAQLVKGTVGFAGALDVTAPTAKDGQFAGTDLPTAHVQGLLGIRSGRRISLAFNGGFLARQSTQFLLLEQGSDLTYGAAIGLRILDKVAIIGEASGAYGVVGAEGKVSPLEMTLGVRVRASQGATVGIGGGSGFGKAVGVADMRGFVSLAIAPGASKIEPVRIIIPPPPRDTGDNDNDGVVNADDQCPGDAEDADAFKDDDGCPDPDNDNDTFLDGEDKCPTEAEDKDGVQDEDGCIDADNDGDGVNDVDDKCPNVAEDKDGFNDNDGCDEPDNDNDGVPDVLDQCALEPETVNGTDDEDGCPDKGDAAVMLMQDRIEVLEPIQFVGTTSKLKPGAAKVLAQVGATMRAERGLKRVRVTVHVHPRGGGDDALSEKRAEEIRKWLVQWGVEPERIDAKGIGSKRPLVAKGKRGAEEINDRVEFIILER